MQPASDSAFDVVDVSCWEAEEPEDMGAREKLWITSSTGPSSPEFLWKAARSAEDIPEYGADACSERMAVEIARLVGAQTAQVDLAVRSGERGVVSARITGELRHGNELLSGLVAGYETTRKGAVIGYSLDSIRSVLDGYQGWSDGFSAFDSFVGLLVFDALVGNTDRHHENWAVAEDTQVLAPSFDHGASLGFNASPTQMTDPRRYAHRAKARHFGPGKTLAGIAREALGMVTGTVCEHWTRSVSDIERSDVERIVHSLPAGWMSPGRRTFVIELVSENRRRLLT